MRVDKLTLAVLEATLVLFLDESLALKKVPTLSMLRRSPAELDIQAQNIANELRHRKCAADINVIDGFSQMGSGSLPAQNLPTKLAAIVPKKISVDALAQKLRMHEPPIVARIHNDCLLLDPRTLLEDDGKIIINAVTDILGNP